MSVQLDERYQVEAYKAINDSISKTGKAGIVLPTGTGKTYLALKLIEDNLDKKQLLYISSSPTINVQVRKKIQEIYPKEKAEEVLSKLKFITYTGLDRMFKNNQTVMQEYNSDVIILDELHRSGAESWGKAVDYLIEQNNNSQILGMTATPLRTDGQNMIEKRFGQVAYELKLSEAVARGILTLPTYISSRYIFEDDIECLQSKINSIEDEEKKKQFQAKLDKAKKSVENAKGIQEILGKHMKNGKWLVFCNPGDDIEKLQNQAKSEKWFDDINPKQTFLTVESSKPDYENDMALRKFERKGGTDLRVLFSKNMLNEGIHDDEITGEIMLRPTKSYVLFIQQLGRILSKDRQEVPTVLDLVGNIKYFKEFRQEIYKIVQTGIKNGDKKYNTKTLEQFRILEEQEDFIQAFEEIEKSVEEYINKNSVEKTLDVLDQLHGAGIDVTKIKRSKKENGRRQFIALNEVVSKNIIQKLGLDPNDRIGQRIHYMLQRYREEALDETTSDRVKGLGFKKEETKTRAISETLEILEILQKEGVDISKIQQTQTKNGKTRGTMLYEVEDEKIEQIIERYDLDRELPIGDKLYYMMKAYKGTSDKTISDTERKKLIKLGLGEKKKTRAEKTLELLDKLHDEGIDVSKIPKNKRREGDRKLISTTIKDVVPQEIIAKLELNPDEKIGANLTSLKKGYRGDLSMNITPEQREKIEQLGIVTKKDIEVAKERGNATNVKSSGKKKYEKPKIEFHDETEEISIGGKLYKVNEIIKQIRESERDTRENKNILTGSFSTDDGVPRRRRKQIKISNTMKDR